MYIKIGGLLKYRHIISYVQPKIYTKPSNVYVSFGSNYTLFLNAKGSPPITYQWYKNDFPLIGETKNELKLTNIQESDNGLYNCYVKNYSNTIYSNYFNLSVLTTPYFIQDISGYAQSYILGTTFFVESSAIGSSPISYQWYKDGNPIIGQTSNKLFFNDCELIDTGIYYVKAYNSVGSISSTQILVQIVN